MVKKSMTADQQILERTVNWPDELVLLEDTAKLLPPPSMQLRVILTKLLGPSFRWRYSSYDDPIRQERQLIIQAEETKEVLCRYVASVTALACGDSISYKHPAIFPDDHIEMSTFTVHVLKFKRKDGS